jgi:hypothetical protein
MGPHEQVKNLEKLKIQETKFTITTKRKRVTHIRGKIDFEDQSHVEQLHSHVTCDGSTWS